MSSIIAIDKIKFSLSCILALVILISTQAFKDVNTGKEIPVMNVNFYMMGMENIDQNITLQIGENIEVLNKGFEGEILFEIDQIFIDHKGAYLPDLYTDFRNGDQQVINSLINPIEKKGGINVYLFHTYCEENTTAALMGFTPRLRMREYTYAKNSPKFDRIFIAYDGLQDKTTLIHEMGHFLGLKHPWELSPSDQYILGLRNPDIINANHMGYGNDVSGFTKQQLSKMRKNALQFRKYLMSKIITDIYRA